MKHCQFYSKRNNPPQYIYLIYIPSSIQVENAQDQSKYVLELFIAIMWGVCSCFFTQHKFWITKITRKYKII